MFIILANIRKIFDISTCSIIIYTLRRKKFLEQKMITCEVIELHPTENNYQPILFYFHPGPFKKDPRDFFILIPRYKSKIPVR